MYYSRSENRVKLSLPVGSLLGYVKRASSAFSSGVSAVFITSMPCLPLLILRVPKAILARTHARTHAGTLAGTHAGKHAGKHARRHTRTNARTHTSFIWQSRFKIRQLIQADVDLLKYKIILSIILFHRIRSSDNQQFTTDPAVSRGPRSSGKAYRASAKHSREPKGSQRQHGSASNE